MTLHDDELAITLDTVRALVSAQFPEWGELPIRRIEAGGTVNAIFRIGDDLAARLPLRSADPDVTRTELRREADAAALLAQHCPAPVPLALGEPGPGYPLPWSVQTWLPGTTADADGSVALAHDLAALVLSLRAVDTGGRRFTGDNRGGDLRAHDGWMETCFARSENLLDVPRLRALWRELRDLPRGAPDVMTHGDLIPANVLVTDGRLAGVLDGGGFAPADPALDAIAGWHLLDDGPRDAFRADLGCDDLEWERSKAWAFEQALGLIWYYADTHPAMSALGHRTLARVCRT